MIHYRLLNEGEPIQQGDQEATSDYDSTRCWWDEIAGVGSPVQSGEIIRRPLGSETCDHVMGCERDADGYILWRKSTGVTPDEPFNFCPLCGMPLEVGK